MAIFAKKGNKVRRIDEASVQKYSDQGYTIINDKGDVLKESVPTDLTLLKTAYIQHTRQIKMLEDEVASLKAQLTKATKKADKPADSEKKRGRTKSVIDAPEMGVVTE